MKWSKERAAHARGRQARSGAKGTTRTKKNAKVSVPLGQVASVIRSKLSGPFRVTFDVVLPDLETYEAVVAADIFTKKKIASLFNLPASCISSIYKVPMANAIKFTMKRRLDPLFSTSDSHGAQQHSPLIDLQVPALWRSRR
jgi:hypothetical protein